MLERHLAKVRGGRSAVLVLRGEAGIGKTALLEYAGDRAEGFRVVRAAGVEAEMELAFGGVHQLCAPFLGHLGRLPDPQRTALETAFGISAGTPPDRFLVGLAVLSLLADVSQESTACLPGRRRAVARPRFGAGRRVRRPAVDGGARRADLRRARARGERALEGLPELTLGGLSVTRSPRSPQIRAARRVRRHGPEPAPRRSPRKPAGPAGAAACLLSGGDRRGFASPDRTTALQHPAGQLHAAGPGASRGNPPLSAAGGGRARRRRPHCSRGAADVLGISMNEAAPALAAGLLAMGTRVQFRHPLVRTAAYYAAEPPERREAHRALAEATDAGSDPDRRACASGSGHRGAGRGRGPGTRGLRRPGPGARRDRRVGGLPGASRRADARPSQRRARALAAARAKYLAGGFDAALELLNVAELDNLDDRQRARASLLRGQITFGSRGGSATVPLLLTAAGATGAARRRRRTRDLPRRLLRRPLRRAGSRPGPGSRRSPPPCARRAEPPFPGTTDLLLDGLAVATTDGYTAGALELRYALSTLKCGGFTADKALSWLPFACRMAHNVWDFEVWSILAEKLVHLARETGALSVLPSALLLHLATRVFAGDLAEADSLAAEAATIAGATGSHFLSHYGALVIESWRGREAETLQAIETVARDGNLSGEGKVLTASQWALAVLYNGLGRYEEACAAAVQGCAYPQELGLALSSLSELVEAAARSGRHDLAVETADRLAEIAQATETAWASGTAATARALVSEGDAAEARYREAIETLKGTQVRTALARTQLLYGEWLRRENRPGEARDQLTAAHTILDEGGMEAFAGRAREELEATGERCTSVRHAATPRSPRRKRRSRGWLPRG
ncbi:LuxR family transcriptional regulator [Yinghuangia aomiensis]